jgi:hypothetical protein
MSDPGPRRVVDRLQTRVDHLNRLQDEESGFVVDDANTTFQTLYDEGRQPASILVRSSFVARKKFLLIEGDRDKTPRPKPPAADIVRSRGLALRLELALLFVQQCSRKPGARLRPVVAQGDELGLINLFATGTRRKGATSFRKQRSEMRATQVRNALDILNRRGLVELGPALDHSSSYERMWLRSEGGPAPGKDPSRYKELTTAEPTVSLPIAFFTKGWIQVLSDSEIWNWLAFRQQGRMTAADSPPGKDLALPAVQRLGWYDLTRDAWDTHIMLDRLGLMTVNPGEVTTGLTAAGNQRFEREPHQFDLDDSVLSKPGHPAVLAAVAAALDEAHEK